VVLVWALSVAYVWALLDRGWVPHDEGALAESALRVLRGEVPHRDFDEIYSGGLSYLNALAFTIWGDRLVSMRYMAFLAFAGWVPVLYYLASRFTGALTAAFVTLVAVAWSFPNYTAAMPSWYNLFLACASLAALFRYLETARARWLAVAGGLAALSCLVKIVGLYLVAGTLLFFVLVEQPRLSGSRLSAGLDWYRWAIILAGVAFVGGLVRVVGPRLGGPEFVQFVVPGLAIAACIILRELRADRSSPRERLDSVGRLVVPYAIGFLVPLVLFVAFYATQGGAGDLAAGLLVKPFRRLAYAGRRPPPLVTMLPTLAVTGAIVGMGGLSKPARRAVVALLGCAFGAILLAGDARGVGPLGFVSLSQAVPITVILALLVVRREGGAQQKSELMLLAVTAVLAVSTLIQFPWTDPTYFAYIAPLEILAASAALSIHRPIERGMVVVLVGFYLAYPVVWLTPRLMEDKGSRGLTHESNLGVLLPGVADLRIVERRQEYEDLVRLVRAHASGDFIYASPDCPEVYYLAGFRNPTRTLFEFLDDPSGRTAPVLKLVDSLAINVVVINSMPNFSGPMPKPLEVALVAKYPHHSRVGQFTVRWR
jgi:hypothetical protein